MRRARLAVAIIAASCVAPTVAGASAQPTLTRSAAQKAASQFVMSNQLSTLVRMDSCPSRGAHIRDCLVLYRRSDHRACIERLRVRQTRDAWGTHRWFAYAKPYPYTGALACPQVKTAGWRIGTKHPIGGLTTLASVTAVLAESRG